MTALPLTPKPQISERALIFAMAAVQFVNILDFMMVMPLGPDFARSLGISASHIGYIGGSYTAAAAISGAVCSLFLDKFDRRSALLWTLLGLTIGTIAGAFAVSLSTLIGARILAGIFGGPASALTLAIISDVIPPERRGKAMGAVMGSFSIASVLGVPAGLELAKIATWQAPFIGTGVLGGLVALFILFALPPLRLHLVGSADPSAAKPSFWKTTKALLSRKTVILSYVMTVSVMTGMFLVIPNLAPYMQFNLGFPRSDLGMLYMLGGSVSFALMMIAGKYTDRLGAIFVGTIGTILQSMSVLIGVALPGIALPASGLFIGFMAGSSIRNVAYNTLTSRVPRAKERAGFLSLQSAVSHIGAAAGAFLSSILLSETTDGLLSGMQAVAFLSFFLTAIIPFFMFAIERELRRG